MLEVVESEEIAGVPLEVEGTAWLDREPVLCPIELLLFKGSKSSSSSANISSESCSLGMSVVGWLGSTNGATGEGSVTDDYR